LKDEGRGKGMVIRQMKGMGGECGEVRDGWKYARNIFPERKILCLH
jgi:hypothetical protein